MDESVRRANDFVDEGELNNTLVRYSQGGYAGTHEMFTCSICILRATAKNADQVIRWVETIAMSLC